MNTNTANEVKQQLEGSFPELTVTIKGYASNVGVFATAKKVTLLSTQFEDLSRIATGHITEFGRSGANFRMIIY